MRLFSRTIILLTLCFVPTLLLAQTTGKVFGVVYDANTSEPLVGVNIILGESGMGASTDGSGEFIILSVPPKSYTLRAEYLGYKTVILEDVRVSVNRTASVRIEMDDATVEGEEVIVVAEKVATKKDQTASIKNISAEQIEILPVDGLDAVIEQQAGVVAGHFRGGRLTEVSYLVDGLPVDEGFTGESRTVQIENESVQDLEVITGTFNAEYGRALSGIVNIVTKDGSKEFHGSVSGQLSNYVTSNDDIFLGLSSSEFDRNQDFKMQLEGPVLSDKLTFLVNYRFQDRLNHLNGINRFLPDDYSNFQQPDYVTTGESPWTFADEDNIFYSEHTGDESFVPMTWSKDHTVLGKLTFRPSISVKLSGLYSGNRGETPGEYDHAFKYAPNSRATSLSSSDLLVFQADHVINKSMFHNLKFSYNNSSAKRYLFEDPLDPQYVSDNYDRSEFGFRTGGHDRVHNEQFSTVMNYKYDLTWQVNKRHSLKLGGLYIQHDIENAPQVVRNSQEGESGQNAFVYDASNHEIIFNPYIPELIPSSSVVVDQYSHKPYEFAAYLQDKMEFDALVLNAGLRFDYFNPNTVYPSQVRNPANQLSFPDNPERMSTYPSADAKMQYSPRFGLAYRVGDAAIIRFSYGHFFQMPPFYALYQNSDFLVPTGDFATIHGNPQINAERTIQYEMGIWQEVMPGMGVEFAVFYRDIYDLQSAVVITTYNQIKYGQYSNKDYGNVKGFEVKYDFFRGAVSAFLNYTWQYTRGNADDPNSSFSRVGESKDPISSLITLAWDQRHTLNFTVGYTKPSFGASVSTFYNSGLPYSYVPISESPLSQQPLLPNNGRRPSTLSLDAKMHYNYDFGGSKKIRLSLLVFNLLDTLNEVAVDATTGRAYTTIVTPTLLATFRSNYNDILDASQNPGMFAAPREVKLGMEFIF